MNHSQLTETFAGVANVTKADADKLIRALTALVIEQAQKGEDVTLIGLGKFKVKETAARTGRNPKTGEAVQIAAKKKLAFTASSDAKAALNK